MIPALLGLDAICTLEKTLALPPVRRGAVAIDAWSTDASCAGQTGDDRTWWSTQSHDQARQAFLDRLAKHDLATICDVIPRGADEVSPPERGIEILHIDGNHGEQAMRDVERFAPAVEIGGVLILDDLAWSGGHVTRARDRALHLGFERMYPLGTGEVLRRIHR